MRWILMGLMTLIVAGCGGGAVVFAPTPLPPDVSPQVYDHPSGAFSVTLPRSWPVYEQNLTTLAAAAFAAPGTDEPALRFAVINLGERISSEQLGALINQYQADIRPDPARHTESSRQAMGDGSWRLTGLQALPGGLTRQTNTFIQAAGAALGIIEVTVPDDPARRAELQLIINTFSIHADAAAAALQPTQLSALAYAASGGLNILNVSTWTTAQGVLFITGEVANTGPLLVTDVPVRARLLGADGLALGDASDMVMGYGIPPGGFAPFSLRFGGGRLAQAVTFELALGGENWQSDSSRTIYGLDQLSWIDQSQMDAEGRLIITGSVTNISDQPARDLLAVVTVFDARQNVIAGGFGTITDLLNPGEPVAFQIVVPELGGEALNYILSIQARP